MLQSWKGFMFGLGLFTILTFLFIGALPADAATVTIDTESGAWKDTNGVDIHAQSGYIMKDGDTYWWYGREGLGEVKGNIRAYSSKDLVNWTDEGVSLTTNGTACRPVVFYNDLTGKYVMYVGLDPGPERLRFRVFVGDSPGGTFTWVRDIEKPDGFTIGDIGGFKDNDGKAYLLYNSDEPKNNWTFLISRLTPDYLNIEEVRVFKQRKTDGNGREAYHIVHHPDGKYYLFSSHTSGWKPSKSMYKTADSLDAFPTTGGNAGFNDGWNVVVTTPQSGNSYFSQHDFVLKIDGTSGGSMYMFAGDRWPEYAANAYPDVSVGGHNAWFPLEFIDGVPTVHGLKAWNLDLTTATWKDAKPDITPLVTGTKGVNGWYVSDVSISWNIDSTVAVTSEGCERAAVTADVYGQTFTCTAASKYGTSNTTVTINRDAAAPVVAYTGNAGSYSVDQQIQISCKASDALSGVATSTCADIVGPAYTFKLGANRFAALAADQAGNTGMGDVEFTVFVTFDGLSGVVDQFVAEKGLANSLKAKLRNAEAAKQRGQIEAASGLVAAFQNEASAQIGKALTAQQANVLITLAEALK